MTDQDNYRYPKSVMSLSVMQDPRNPPASPQPVAPPAAASAPQPAPSDKSLSDLERKLIEGKVIAAIRTVYDPEIPVNIHDLGLIYKIDVRPDATVRVEMTLTAPGCPVAGEMPGWVQNAVGAVEGVSNVEVNMVFDPPWTPERMSEEAQVAVGWY